MQRKLLLYLVRLISHHRKPLTEDNKDLQPRLVSQVAVGDLCNRFFGFLKANRLHRGGLIELLKQLLSSEKTLWLASSFASDLMFFADLLRLHFHVLLVAPIIKIIIKRKVGINLNHLPVA